MLRKSKDNQNPKEHKTFRPFQLKIDEAQGIVEEIVAVMGNIDEGDDVIHNGAFAKTIQERLGKIRVLDQHNTDSILRIVGKPLAMRELSKGELPQDLLNEYPEATGGLVVTTQYLMDTPEGKGAFIRAKNRTVEYSIGYDALDFDYSKAVGKDGKQKTVRNLRTIKLWEYSPVLWGMNPATMTVSAKAVTPYHDMPLADREVAWDAADAEKRVREWAGGEDNIDWAKYRRAFFWYDADNAEKFGSYKLGYADVSGSNLVAVPRAIFAVAAVLQGGRGGVNIPAADQEAIKRQVSRWYKKMAADFDDDSIVAPWDKAADKALKVNLSDLVETVAGAFYEQFGRMTQNSEYYVREVHDDHLIVCEMEWMGKPEYYSVPYTMTEGMCNFAPADRWQLGEYVFQPTQAAPAAEAGEMMSTPGLPDESKVGRVLSRRNAEAMRSAVQGLVDVLKAAGVWEDSTDEADDEADTGKSGKATEPAVSTPQGGAAGVRGNEQGVNPAGPQHAPTIELEMAELDLLKVKAIVEV